MSDSVLDVINGIKDTTIEWKKSLDIANDKSLKAIEYGFQKLLDKTNFYRKDIVKLKAEWELIKKEVSEIKKEKKVYDDRKQAVEDQAKQNEEQEQSLIDLHTALVKRGQALDKRDENLREKEKIASERIVTPV